MEKNNQPENTPSFARKEDTASTASVPESPLADSPKLGEPKTEAPTYSETKEGESEKSEEEKTDQVEEKPAEEAPPPPYSLEKALEDIDQFLSNFPVKNKDENDMPLEIPVFVEKFLDLVEDNIGKYDSKADPVKSKWCQVAEEDALFIEALDRISKLNAAVVEFKSDASHGSLINRAGGLQQRVMSYLEEEFRLLLGDSSKEYDRGVGDGSAKLKDSESDRCNIREPESEDDDFPGYSEEVLYGLNRIAKEMISGGHESECCELYMIARREAFDECLINLGFGKISVDDVQKMQWDALENEIATWSKTFKQCATVYFQGERKLADKIFRDSPSIAGSLFSNLTRGVLIQLLNFAEAIAMSKRSAEKLFKFLDIYETLRDSLPAMDGLFEEESAGELKTETTTARCRIGEAAVCIFCDLENSIKSETGKTPVPGGAVHPLTRYTMNYLNYACDQYKDTLEQVFKEHSKIERAESSRRSQCDGQDNETQDQSRFSSQLMRVMDLLDANLEAQSKLYKDTSLSSIFLMNNGRYILQKIKGSAEIHQVMGDTLCRKRSSYLRNYHKGYQRETWNKLLGCLSHEGLQVNGKVVKPVLKERFKSFNAMFDEIHRTQSCWIVNDEQLQSELRVSISGVVIPAYRSFLGRFSQHLDAGRQTEKYVKFQAEDIENAIEELFEGNPTSMVRRKP